MNTSKFARYKSRLADEDMATLTECLLDDTNDVGEVLPATKRIRRSKAIKNEAILAVPSITSFLKWTALMNIGRKIDGQQDGGGRWAA